MTNLKTLKGITNRIVPLFPIKSLKRKEANSLLNTHCELLKEEAVEWIKFMNDFEIGKGKKVYSSNFWLKKEEIMPLIKWIKHFFNIEDLK